MACRSTATIFTSSPGSAPFFSSLRPLGAQQKQNRCEAKHMVDRCDFIRFSCADEEDEEKAEEEELT